MSVVGDRTSKVAAPGHRATSGRCSAFAASGSLLAIRLTSQFSDGLFQAALAGSVLFNPAQQTSPVKIAAGFAVLLVPFSMLGPFVGVFLDRWSRRNIIYMANLLRAVLAVPGRGRRLDERRRHRRSSCARC